MLSDVLFYPAIGMQNSNLIKAMSLLYDNIYRIVPDNVIPNDNPELQALLEEGSVGKMIDPVNYSKAAADEFLHNLSNWEAAALEYSFEEEPEFSMVHKDKMDFRVRQLFEKAGFETNNIWLNLPTEIASSYLLYLATNISKSNNLGLITEDWGAWTGTSFFNLNGKIDDTLSPEIGADYLDDPFALFCLLVSDITPLNIAEIPAEEILNFRIKRVGEIANFRNCLDELYKELQLIQSEDIKIDLIEKKAKSLQKAKEDYQASADIIKAKGWFGTSMMGFPAPAIFGQLMEIPTASTVALATTGLMLGGLYSIKSTKNELEKLKKENPVSCLVEMSKSFRNYTSSRGGGDINFHAYNCMEEFIND